MANTSQVKKEFKVYSVEASNSSTPGSYHLVIAPSTEKFKTYEEAQSWVETEGEKTDYTILEIITRP
jgi:hypothetical protein